MIETMKTEETIKQLLKDFIFLKEGEDQSKFEQLDCIISELSYHDLAVTLKWFDVDTSTYERVTKWYKETRSKLIKNMIKEKQKTIVDQPLPEDPVETIYGGVEQYNNICGVIASHEHNRRIRSDYLDYVVGMIMLGDKLVEYFTDGVERQSEDKAMLSHYLCICEVFPEEHRRRKAEYLLEEEEGMGNPKTHLADPTLSVPSVDKKNKYYDLDKILNIKEDYDHLVAAGNTVVNDIIIRDMLNNVTFMELRKLIADFTTNNRYSVMLDSAHCLIPWYFKMFNEYMNGNKVQFVVKDLLTYMSYQLDVYRRALTIAECHPSYKSEAIESVIRIGDELTEWLSVTDFTLFKQCGDGKDTTDTILAKLAPLKTSFPISHGEQRIKFGYGSKPTPRNIKIEVEPVPSGVMQYEYDLSKGVQPLSELDATDSSEKRSKDVEITKSKVDLNATLKQQGIEWLLNEIEHNQRRDVDYESFIPITVSESCGTVGHLRACLTLVDEITIPGNCIQSEAYVYIKNVYKIFELKRPVIILDNK